MSHHASQEDVIFTNRVESCQFPVADFDHRAHLRLAYVYLSEDDVDTAVEKMRDALVRLLTANEIEPAAKYHETLTKAWILAVHHFMSLTNGSASADEFIDKNPEMLDASIMLTHYSAEALFSDEARKSFVQPDLDPIPRPGG